MIKVKKCVTYVMSFGMVWFKVIMAKLSDVKRELLGVQDTIAEHKREERGGGT